MADDALAELGLDAKSFRKEINAVNAHLKSLEGEEKRVNAEIALLEKNMRLAGKATGAQVAQLGQLRQALRAIKGDLKEVARGQASLGAIDPNAANAEKESGGGGRRSGLSILGVSITIGVITAALRRLGEVALETSERINRSRDKFSAGSERLATRTGNIDPVLSEVLNKRVDDGLERAKNETGGFFSKIMAGVMVLKDLKFGANGLEMTSDSKAKLHDQIKAGKEADEGRKNIRSIEDEITNIESAGVVTMDEKLALLEKQKQLSEAQLKLADNLLVKDRQATNQAMAQIGAIAVQMDALKFQREQIGMGARAETAELRLQQEGLKNVGAMVKLEADYTAKIAQARREGNTELAAELALQLQLKQNQLQVAEHNLSPRQLANERKDARKFARDLAHQGAREADIADRINRGAHGFTKGSRADRLRAQQGARAGVVPTNMTVQDMKVANMTLTLPR